MRILSLAAVTTFVVIAACSDVAAPIVAGSDVESLTDGGGAAHFLGGRNTAIHGKHGHDDDRAPPECGGDDDRDHHHHWSWRGHRRGHHFSLRGKHGFSTHMMGNAGQGEGEDCGGGGEETPATIGGTVTNNGAGANTFPVFLLNPAGTTVVASTTTATDGTGSYSFDVAPGPYLVCEADPFVEIYGFLGQTRPAAGPPCPTGYAPIGFVVEVAAGDTATGNNFVNFGLE